LIIIYIICRDYIISYLKILEIWYKNGDVTKEVLIKVWRRYQEESTLTICTKLDLLIYYWEIYLLDNIPFAIDIKDYPAINEKEKVVW